MRNTRTRTRAGFHRGHLSALTLALGLTGCAGVYRVDNRVESFARWSEAGTAQGGQATAAVPAAPQTYRFERLPSQASGTAAQSQSSLESLAEAALAPLGWTPAPDPASAPWTVQITASHQRLPRAPWEDPWDDGRWSGWSTRVQIGVSGGQIMWSPAYMWGAGLMRPDMPYHLRRISLVIREARQGQVVFETSAAHDGRWNSTPKLWSAMLNAALKDFPAPPNGQRDINIDVTR